MLSVDFNSINKYIVREMQHTPSDNIQKSATVKVGEFSTGGFSIGIKAELETPHNPLIFLEILEESRGLMAMNLVFDPKSLRKIGRKLLKAADASEREIQKYWEERI